MGGKMRLSFALLLWGILSPILAADTSACLAWPAWEDFKATFLSQDGRVIDLSTPRQQSTSEGQAYALFFALVADDQEAFSRLLKWTESNLAQGDLTAQLPAWQWGETDDGEWTVPDQNSASDADLWLAYTLAEAGEIWQVPRFKALGALLAARILREETADLPGLGLTLLPAPKGFVPEPDYWRLNPSYVPIQLLRRLNAHYPGGEWQRLLASSWRLLLESSPSGLAPDWVAYRSREGFLPDPSSNAKGSFDAIRVYLWAGLLPAEDPFQPEILKHLVPMATLVTRQGTPPLVVDSRTGTAEGTGPWGFSAALAPFLQAAGASEAATLQWLRVDARPSEAQAEYYNQSLRLFAEGWRDERYRFQPDGSLRLPTAGKCQSR